MQNLSEVLTNTKQKQYSTVTVNNLNYSNSTVDLTTVFGNLSDIIPEDDYRPFYVSHYKKLGYNRFMELANKARMGKTPPRLFFWMLKNHQAVR